jgi:hypothetical protein
MRSRAICHLVAHSRLQHVTAAVRQLRNELTLQAQQNVTLAAPMIREVTSRILNHTDTDRAELTGAPQRHPLCARMLGMRQLRPVDHGEWQIV